MIETFDLAAFLANPVKASALALSLVFLGVTLVLYFFRQNPAVSKMRAFSVYAQLAFVFSSSLAFALATTCAYMLLPCHEAGWPSIAAFSVPAAILLVIVFGPSLFSRLYAFYSKASLVKSGALKKRLDELSAACETNAPALYVVDSANPSAFSFSGPNSAIFITVGMLDLLTEKELDAVFLHELSHVKSKSSTFKLSVALLRAFQFFKVVPVRSFNCELSAEEKKADDYAASMQKTGRFLCRAKKKLDAYRSN